MTDVLDEMRKASLSSNSGREGEEEQNPVVGEDTRDSRMTRFREEGMQQIHKGKHWIQRRGSQVDRRVLHRMFVCCVAVAVVIIVGNAIVGFTNNRQQSSQNQLKLAHDTPIKNGVSAIHDRKDHQHRHPLKHQTSRRVQRHVSRHTRRVHPKPIYQQQPRVIPRQQPQTPVSAPVGQQSPAPASSSPAECEFSVC